VCGRVFARVGDLSAPALSFSSRTSSAVSK
jgi:hypothetical protein